MKLERLAELELLYDAGSVSISDEVDMLCDEFEQVWQSGQSPNIEDFVVRIAPELQDQLRTELMALEHEYRRQVVRESEFEERFASPAPEASASPSAEATRDVALPTVGAPSVREGLPPGAMISHYERLESIGSGGFGSVWRARDVHLQRIVAVKVAHHPLDGGVTPERFLREARIAAKLTHPGIVRVLDVGCESERAFIVSEYIEGQNLDRWYATETRTFADAAEICRKIALALEYAHQQRVFHRDMKPANILVDARGEPHIADFGVAKCEQVETQQTLDGHLLGTPAYMSPEQAAGRSNQVDARSDVYSLGVVLYQLLTGQVPFAGTLTDVLQQIQHADPPALSIPGRRIPQDLESICLKALSKLPDDRYLSAQELADDLQRFLRNEPTLARPLSPMRRLWRRFRQSSIKTTATAFIAMALPLAGFYSAFSAWHRMDSLVTSDQSAPVKSAALNPEPVVEFRKVQITSDPPGAQVAIAPIIVDTLQTRDAEVIRPADRTPLTIELPVGSYLIVANIPHHGFNEVYREVPSADQKFADVMHRTRPTAVAADGTVILREIPIPTASQATSGLAQFSGGTFTIGDGFPGSQARRERTIASYYLQTTEVTVGNFRQAMPEQPLDNHGILDDSYAVTGVSCMSAIAYAEMHGLRLPTREELLFAATNAGQSLYPWGDDNTPIGNWEIGPVGTPQFDHTNTSIPVYGLFSNVAEWTDSRQEAVVQQGIQVEFPEQLKDVLRGSRVVCGGPASVVMGQFDARERDFTAHFGAPWNERQSFRGVGFRCARSVKPRFFD